MEPPLPPLIRSMEDRDRDRAQSQAPHGYWVAVLVVVAVVTDIGVIIAGIALGGAWRWASGAAIVVGIAVIAVPAITDRPRGGRR